jgi:hypothetical protein
MGRPKSGKTDLEATSQSLARWRSQYGGRGKRIPVAFWDQARDLAVVYGVADTARALRLDGRRLATMSEPAPLAIAPKSAEPEAFVELGELQVGVRGDSAVVEFLGREGDRMRVQVAAAAVDVVGLAKAFWDRRS